MVMTSTSRVVIVTMTDLVYAAVMACAVLAMAAIALDLLGPLV